jgi:hypothetical protein
MRIFPQSVRGDTNGCRWQIDVGGVAIRLLVTGSTRVMGPRKNLDEKQADNGARALAGGASWSKGASARSSRRRARRRARGVKRLPTRPAERRGDAR